MLPTTAANGERKRSLKHSYVTYLRRLIRPKQMDTEYTFWLMLQLCTAPKTAYRQTAYHKQTKNQWARDDPAFVVVCAGLVAMAALAYCVTYSDSLWHSLLTVLSAVLVDFLMVGFAISTAAWFIANRFLRKRNLPHHQVEQDVEWMYAFDVHCNSYLPMFLLLYVLQFFLSPLLVWKSYLSSTLSVALYAGALSHYHYMSFLGYSALPFLERTQVFLWPVGLILVAAPFAALLGFNPTRFVLSIYFS